MTLRQQGAAVHGVPQSQPPKPKRTTGAERDAAIAGRYGRVHVTQLRHLAEVAGARSAVLHAVLAGQGSDEGLCLWSVERLAAIVGIGVPTTRRYLRELAVQGLLVVDEDEQERRGIRTVLRDVDLTDVLRVVREQSRRGLTTPAAEVVGNPEPDPPRRRRAIRTGSDSIRNGSPAIRTGSETIRNEPSAIRFGSESIRFGSEKSVPTDVSSHHCAEDDAADLVHERRAERRLERRLEPRGERRTESPDADASQTGASAPERPDMPTLTDQWQDLQAEAEDLWSDTTDGRPSDVPPKADASDALTALLTDPPDELHATPSAEKPDATDATTPSDRGGSHAGEPQPTPATPPPHSALPPPAQTQQEPAQAALSLFGPVTPAPSVRVQQEAAPFVLEPPPAKTGKKGKPECPPAALARIREAWLRHVGGRKGAMPAGFASEVADLLGLCSGDVDTVCHAIKGFARSDFHMGRDERSGGKSWKSPRYVGRHLDDFLGMADEAEKTPNGVAAEAFRAAELQVKKLSDEHSAQIGRELHALPAATSEYARTRFQATPLDREGTVRGVKVAWRAWHDHDGVHAKRISCLSFRLCTLAVLVKEAAGKWGAGSMQVHVLRQQIQERAPTLDCLAELNAWDIEARAAAIAAMETPPTEETACAPELDRGTQAAQPLAAKEPAHV